MDFKADFPFFHHRPEVVYLDNAATSQKPKAVLDAIAEHYARHNSNIHRGPNFLSEEATVAYEKARKTVADFVNAKKPHEVIFTRNSTEAINLVAWSYGVQFSENDDILLTRLEHHSNIVPWLSLKEWRGVGVKYITVDEAGQLVFDETQFTEKTKLLAITGMSNGLGVIPNLKPFIEAAHNVGAKVLVDASQLAVHSPIDVQSLGADFVVFTGHKLYGPTGIGVLWAKEELLEAMPPFLGGGDMINEVFEDHFTVASLPNKFEAGTPNIAGVIGLGAAIEFVQKIGWETIQKTEGELTQHLLDKLTSLRYITLVGPSGAEGRGSVVSFLMDDVHPHDIAEGLSQKNIVIRAGHHCNQVLMDHLKIPGTARISLAFYNTKAEIDKTVAVLEEIYNYFK